MSDQEIVQAFISYSWASSAHSDWVLALATRLREDGVDAKLDKWDLKTGDDAYAYMESMVTDQRISKVILVCDRTYVEKANDRKGGVGAETQILTPELYGKKKQDKFAAVITELSEDGEALVPAFYKGRIYIDFSDPERFEIAYEELLRWLLDKPLHEKPKLGAVPAYILNKEATVAATTSSFRRADAALRSPTSTTKGALRAYGELLIEELKNLMPAEQGPDPIDERVIAATNLMRPYVKQLHELAYTYCRFDESDENVDLFIDILEKIGQLTEPDQSVSQWMPVLYETYHIVCYEAMIGFIAILLAETRFAAAARVINHPYLAPNRSGGAGPSTRNISFFNNYCRVFEARKQRLNLNRISLRADYMKENYDARPTFDQIMQADFVLFLNDAFNSSDSYGQWYPDTLLFASNRYRPFDLFARSESRSYFDRWFPKLVSDLSIDLIRARLAELQKDRGSRMFDHWGLPIVQLANADHLGTKP